MVQHALSRCCRRLNYAGPIMSSEWLTAVYPDSCSTASFCRADSNKGGLNWAGSRTPYKANSNGAVLVHVNLKPLLQTDQCGDPHLATSSCLWRGPASASRYCKRQTSQYTNNRLSLWHLGAPVCIQLCTAESHALSSMRAQTVSPMDNQQQ